MKNQQDKLGVLLNFIEKEKDSKIMIFLATCASVDFYAYLLPLLTRNRSVSKLHSQIKQKKRTKIYQDFLKEESGLLLTTDISARGIDIPDVAWIVQFDPPQDSDQFVHRIGRTARAGKQGKSVIFLNEREVDYVGFLEGRNVGLEEMKLEGRDDDKLREAAHGMMIKDHDLVDKGQAAFVAFLRYYKEQTLKFIFQFNTLEIGAVGNSFYLFKLPRVREILGVKVKGFKFTRVDTDTIPYKCKNKQK